MSEETEKNIVMDYATQRYAPVSTETTPETEIVTDTPVETPDANVTTEIVDRPTAEVPAETTAPVETVVDYSKIISEASEGLFPDIDAFKASLPKIKDYDTLVAKNTELEEKLKVDPFANDYARTINEMLLAGKSAEAIENFTKISKLDIDSLPADEVKVMRLVKEGYSESVARQKVALDYPIEDYEEGTPRRLVLEEELRISSIEDRNVLKEYKKELTTIDNSAQVAAQQQAEQQRLEQIANAEQHKQVVKQAIPKIAETISGLGEKNLNGKEGEEAVKLNFEYNADYKAELPQKLEAFFIDSQMPLNDENIALAQKYIRADYLEKNFDTISQQIFKHAEAITTEKVVNKYENRSGLPEETTTVIVDDTKQQYNEFLNRVATRG